MPRGSDRDTDRSTISGGYTEQMDRAGDLFAITPAVLDPTAVAAWLHAHGALPEGTTLRSLAGETRYARVSAAASELGVRVEALNAQAPWVVGLELADLEYLHQGFDPQQGVEEQLTRRAQSDRKHTAGLETIDEELGGLESLGPDDQLRLLDQTLDEPGQCL